MTRNENVYYRRFYNSFFKNSTNNNAEKNFSNLFMWRHTYEYEYALIDECLCIKGKTRGDKKTFYHFPYGSCEKEVILSILEKKSIKLFLSLVK